MAYHFARASVIALLLALSPSAFAEEAPTKSLKIGAVLSLSGDAAINGESIRKGVTLATEELRANGWKVDLNFQDDATNPTKTVSSVRYLLTQDYRLFVGPTWSFLTKAAKPLLETSNALAVVPSGSTDVIGGPSDKIFNLCPKRTGQLAKVAEWLKTRSYKRAFILTPLGDWGVVHREVFQQAAQQAGIKITGDEEFDYGLSPGALRSILLRAKSQGADLLLTTASGGDLANMLKFRAEMKWPAHVLTTEDLWDSIDGGLISSHDAMLKDAWVVGLPLNLAFNARFQSRFNETPRMYADRSYDAVMLLARTSHHVGVRSPPSASTTPT